MSGRVRISNKLLYFINRLENIFKINLDCMIFILHLYKNHTDMTALNEIQVEKEIVKVIKAICSKMKIDVDVDSEFCPGDYIRSQILLTFIPTIGSALNIDIPNSCYIFSDNHYNQLSIHESTKKLLKVAQNGK
jgi:hypothetical protein